LSDAVLTAGPVLSPAHLSLEAVHRPTPCTHLAVATPPTEPRWLKHKFSKG
jgi:hypothetical protein